MNDRDRTPQNRECGGDVAAYALGALDPAEADAFLRHLDTCSVCRDELASFQEVVTALPMSAPRHRASPELRRRVLRAIDDEPAPAGAPRRAARGRVRVSRWAVPRSALAFSTALAILVLAFVAVSLTSSSGPGTRVIDAKVTGHGTAQLRIGRGQAELVVHHFSPPPAGQIYRGVAPAGPGLAVADDGAVQRDGCRRWAGRRARQPSWGVAGDGHA